MRSLRFKRVCLALWVGFIWLHSLASGQTSSLESGFFVKLLHPLAQLVGLDDLDTLSFLVRKAAHFSEYFVLALLALGAELPSLFVGTLGLFVPLIDEGIQLFVPGRAGMIRDVGIDISGFVVGCVAVLLLLRWRTRRHKSRA